MACMAHDKPRRIAETLVARMKREVRGKVVNRTTGRKPSISPAFPTFPRAGHISAVNGRRFRR